MITQFQNIKQIIPLKNPSKIEDSVEILINILKIIRNFSVEFKLILSDKNLWVLESELITEYYGEYLKHQPFNRYKTYSNEAILVLFNLIRDSVIENYSWSCLDCKEINYSEKIILNSRITNVSYRVECKKCKRYHWQSINDNIIYLSLNRPLNYRWK